MPERSSTEVPIRVLLADDHQILRHGLKMLLPLHPEIEVVGEAGTGREAIAQVLAFHPDVVVLDLSMPDRNGMEACEAICAQLSETRVLILTMHENEASFFQALHERASMPESGWICYNNNDRCCSQRERSPKIFSRAHRRIHLNLLMVPILMVLLTACATSGSQTPTGGAASAFHTTLKTSDGALLVQLTVTPNHLGSNQFTVSVQDASSKQPVSHLQVQLFTTMLDMAMGTDTLSLQAQNNGTYSAQGELSMGGHWEISIELRGPDAILHKAQVQFTTQA